MVQMWLSPRDLCALAATAAARARLQRTLAACMGLSSAAPEVLFAMAAFHKFYQRTYERCVNDAGSRVDLHQLVEAPELVHRILEALGFCTFLDDDGVARPLRDERGRPVCAFLSDLRHAAATAGIVHAPMTYLLQFTNLPERLQYVKSQLQQLRPKKSSLLLGTLRLYDLNYNLELWHELNNVLLHHLVRAEHWISKRQETSLADRKYFLKWAQKIIAAARKSAKAVLTHLEKLPEHREARIAARNREESKSTRDQEAQQWRTNFKNFINQSWIPLLDTMDQRAQEQLDAIKPSIELRNFADKDPCFQRHGQDKKSCEADAACRFEPAATPGGQGSCRLEPAPLFPGKPFKSADIGIELRRISPTMDQRAQERSEEPAPQVAGRPFPAPRSDSTAAPGPGPGPEPVPSKNLAAEDLCFQIHGHNKLRCDNDLACHFEPAAKPGGQGSCRLNSASPSSPGGPFVSAFIGDTPHSTQRTEDLRSEPFSPLLRSVSPAPEPKPAPPAAPKPKPAAPATKTSRRALLAPALPSMWTVINSLPGAGSGGAEASMRAHGGPAPPAASAALHRSMLSPQPRLNPAWQRKRQLSKRIASSSAGAPSKNEKERDATEPEDRDDREDAAEQEEPGERAKRRAQQQQKEAFSPATYVPGAVALLAALGTGRSRAMMRR